MTGAEMLTSHQERALKLLLAGSSTPSTMMSRGIPGPTLNALIRRSLVQTELVIQGTKKFERISLTDRGRVRALSMIGVR